MQYAQVLDEPRLVCATNPPYMGMGNLTKWVSTWLKENYPNEKADLCTCFIERAFWLCYADGYNAQVNMHSWMFLDSFRDFRESIISRHDVICMAHLGARAFESIGGEVVQTAATVFSNNRIGIQGTYIRLTSFSTPEEKRLSLIDAVDDLTCAMTYCSDTQRFKAIPGQPFVYHLHQNLVASFSSGHSVSEYCTPRVGLQTNDNNRFVRLWWEVSVAKESFDSENATESIATGCKWFPYNKGGGYRKWWGNNDFVVNWEDDGKEIKELAASMYGSYTRTAKNLAFYFLPAITWSKVSSGAISFRYKPSGHIFDVAGASLFGTDKDLKYLQGALNSSTLMEIAAALSPTLNFETKQIGSYPILDSLEKRQDVYRIVDGLREVARIDWDSFETSWDFTAHPLMRGNRISSAYGRWSAACKDRFDTLKANEERLNAIFARIYHMEGEVPIEVEDDKVSVRRADLGRDVRSLISYAVGCMFGRYSLDIPGLVLANQGDGIPEYLAQVPCPRYMPDEDGILPITDDEYFEDDIVAMFCEFLKAAYGAETFEENLQFVADALDGSGSARKVIRDYFMNQFFADHCATYSVPSAGKRPIYWLLDSGKLGGFRALIYMHRYTPDLLARVRTDYVHERQERYRSRIAELEREREGASRREQSSIDKELKRLRAQLDEVTKFEERLHHLADQMIEIDLDDGFKVNYAKFADVMAKVK